MISQFHTSNTFSLSAILALQTWADENLIDYQNPYVKDVSIPEYTGADNQFLIDTVAKFTEATFADTAIQHFYIVPDDYSAQGKITIADSGIDSARRTLSLYNGDTLHPGMAANDAARANIALLIQADYWTISRMSCIDVDYSNDATGGGTITIDTTSSYNIIDRLYSSNGGYPIRIKANARYNTIQKCYFDTPSALASTQDNSHVMVADWGGDANGFYTTFNTLVLCEGKNYKMIKFHDDGFVPPPQFNGSVVDSNIIWYDEESRTDGSGNLDPLGEYCNVEADGIEFKSGSDNASERITVSNNIYFSGRPIDPTFEPALGSQISMSTAYRGAYYIDYVGNMAFDAVSGIVLADADDDSTYGTDGCTATENICWDMGLRAGAGTGFSAGFRISSSHDFSITDNLFKDPLDEYAYVWYNNPSGTSVFNNNNIVNKDLDIRDTNNSPDVTGVNPIDTNNTYNTASGNAIYTEDYTFTYQKYTNNPIQKTISNVLKPNQVRPLNE